MKWRQGRFRCWAVQKIMSSKFLRYLTGYKASSVNLLNLLRAMSLTLKYDPLRLALLSLFCKWKNQAPEWFYHVPLAHSKCENKNANSAAPDSKTIRLLKWLSWQSQYLPPQKWPEATQWVSGSIQPQSSNCTFILSRSLSVLQVRGRFQTWGTAVGKPWVGVFCMFSVLDSL